MRSSSALAPTGPSVSTPVRRARTHPLGTRSSTIFGRSSSRNGSNESLTRPAKGSDELFPEQVEVCADLHLRPYYGDEDDTDGLYHSVAKRGTTAFHAYATLYARVKNKRYIAGGTPSQRRRYRK